MKRQLKAYSKPIIRFRSYQKTVFEDRTTGLLVIHWSRQIGKSFTLAAWAVDRLLTMPAGHLVTVLSNSKDNGAEFAIKAAEVCRKLDQAFELLDGEEKITDENSLRESKVEYEAMRFEIRLTINGVVSRIKILAANPRTARGFSGDLILDEFAFHEDSRAIWEAAEPILSSNPNFLCRISSTGNGKHNMFYEMATSGDYALSRVTRTEAYGMGVKIYDLKTRQEITPAEARKKARDKRAYDQNYECKFADENTILLTTELINQAERDGVGFICEQDWSPEAKRAMAAAQGDLYLGVDVGRFRDITVMAAVEKISGIFLVRGVLRCENMRLPAQRERLAEFFRMPRARRAAIDMTGIGLGLFEFAEDHPNIGPSKLQGVNFGTSVPATKRIKEEGRKQETVRVTEAMATELLGVYEDRRIQHPCDGELRDDLRKPEKVVSPGGRVSIAAVRDAKDHADHFWGFALAIEAGSDERNPGQFIPYDGRGDQFSRGRELRRERSLVG